MTQFGFFVNQSRCIGCFTCSVACKDWHDITATSVNWMRITQIEEGKFPDLTLFYLPIACNHCKNPPCLLACPTKAIIKRENDGIVIVDSEKCLGYIECGARCLKVCPWDVPQFENHNKAKMQKCDLCVDRIDEGKYPICVEACPMYALDVAPLEELQQKYGFSKEAIVFEFKDKYQPSIIFNNKTKEK